MAIPTEEQRVYIGLLQVTGEMPTTEELQSFCITLIGRAIDAANGAYANAEQFARQLDVDQLEVTMELGCFRSLLDAVTDAAEKEGYLSANAAFGSVGKVYLATILCCLTKLRLYLDNMWRQPTLTPRSVSDIKEEITWMLDNNSPPPPRITQREREVQPVRAVMINNNLHFLPPRNPENTLILPSYEQFVHLATQENTTIGPATTTTLPIHDRPQPTRAVQRVPRKKKRGKHYRKYRHNFCN